MDRKTLRRLAGPAGAFWLALTMGAASAAPSASSRDSVPPPPLRLEVGPERIVCGVTAPIPPAVPGQGNKKVTQRLGLLLWFHGGMRSGNREKGLEAHRPLLAFADRSAWVMASPSAYGGRDWLSPGALSAVDALIDTLSALYPLDPASLRLIGVSDGCLAVIRYGLEGRRPAAAKILISSAPQLVLPLQALGARPRLAEGRWDFLQGGRDRLFPAHAVQPYLQEWERIHPNARLHFFPEGEHDFSWFSTYKADLLRDLLAPQKTQKSKPLQKSPKKT